MPPDRNRPVDFAVRVNDAIVNLAIVHGPVFRGREGDTLRFTIHPPPSDPGLLVGARLLVEGREIRLSRHVRPDRAEGVWSPSAAEDDQTFAGYVTCEIAHGRGRTAFEVYLAPALMTEEHYETICSELRAENSLAEASLFGGTHRWLRHAGGLGLHEQLVRLQLLGRLYPDLAGALAAVRRRPERMLTKVREFLPLEKAGRGVGGQGLAYGLLRSRRFRTAPPGVLAPLAQALRGRVPSTVAVSREVQSFDVHANRFTRAVVLAFLSDLASVRGWLLAEHAGTSKRAAGLRFESGWWRETQDELLTIRKHLSRVDQMIAELDAALHAEPLVGAGPLRGRAPDLVLEFKAGYRRVLDVERRYRRILRASDELIDPEHDLPLRIPAARLSRIYETWCVFSVLRVLMDDLGWAFAPSSRRTRNTPARVSRVLKPGTSVDLVSPRGGLLRIHYEKEYSVEDDARRTRPAATYGVRRRFQKNRPDIAIESFATHDPGPGAVPESIVVLDAKYSALRDPHNAIFFYTRDIKEFSTGRRLVRASYALYPRSRQNLEHDPVYCDNGAIPLLPTREHRAQLSEVLGAVFRKAGMA